MTENELKQNIAKNIAYLRRTNNMTQAELAEKLSYSDKSISKWERGDGLPDVFVLTKIAGLFGVSVNDLLEHDAPTPQAPTPAQKCMSRSRHSFVTALSFGLVWFIAALVFFFIKVFIPGSPWAWMVFVYAIPVAAIVLIVFIHMWWGIIPQCLSVSLLVWSLAVCIHIAALLPQVQNVTMIYVVAGIFQVLVILWYAYRYVRLKWHLSVKPAKDKDAKASEAIADTAEAPTASGASDISDTATAAHQSGTATGSSQPSHQSRTASGSPSDTAPGSTAQSGRTPGGR